MKFSKNWLDEILGVKLSTEQIVAQLTLAGLEVDNVASVGGNFSGVVIGRVLKVSDHPNADRLHVCEVQVTSQGEILEIVCGAPNVREGLTVAVARIGAVLPGDFTIKLAKLRGVTSNGMLCSQRELGLADDHAGIWELPSDAPLGEDLKKYLALDDEIIEIDLTANRGDCLSMLGIARELAALNRLALPQRPQVMLNDVVPDNQMAVTVAEPQLAPCYVGRVITGIDNTRATPIWMKQRLTAAGITPINLAVDITNYIMIYLGQPMHAFDLQRLTAPLTVRRANVNEKLQLLDETELTLISDDLVIADAQGAVALAGVMGGMASKIQATTTAIFLESAYFDRIQVTLAAQRHEKKTEAANRFARGIDWQIQRHALDLATELFVTLAGGKAHAVVECSAPEFFPKVAPIKLERKLIRDILGITISDDTILNIFNKLNIKVKVLDEGWELLPPPYRYDLTIAEDMVEEIARIYGYNEIPEQPLATALPDRVPVNQQLSEITRLDALMEDLGYCEAITYSFIDEKLQRLFAPELKSGRLVNPIAADLGVMRSSLWPGLVQALQYNLKRKQLRVKLFEIGTKFLLADDAVAPEEREVLAGVISGTRVPQQWGVQDLPFDFYDLKHDVVAILQYFLRLAPQELICEPCQLAALHPQLAAQIKVAGKVVAIFGQLHPLIRQKLALTQNVWVFELDLAGLVQAAKIKVQVGSKFPGVVRDLALVAPKNLAWQKIRWEIQQAGGELLQQINLFDIYNSEDLGEGQHSLAVRLRFQALDRTLQDEEIDEKIIKIRYNIESNLGIKLRD